MSPALARAQQADLQAAMGGNVGTIGPGGATGVVPGGKIYLNIYVFFIIYGL